MSTTEKYARVCSITGNGMNEGWVFGEGAFYTSTLNLTLNECRKDRAPILDGLKNLGCELHELGTVQDDEDLKELKEAIDKANNNIETDNDLLTIAYHTDYVYYTEWHEVFDEQDEYYTKDGKLIN